MTGTPLVVLDACVLANFSLCDTLLRLAEPPRLFEPAGTLAVCRTSIGVSVCRDLLSKRRPPQFPNIPAYPSLAYTWEVSEMIAVVETEEFLTDVKGVLSEDEHDDLILYVALHPEAGDLIPATGGLRKLRWAAKGKGKRGGSRVIYYFHNIDVPLFLMAIFAKSVQTDLSARQRAALSGQLRGLKSDWKEKLKK